MQLTETGDDDLPHVMTPVETTPASLADCAALPRMHQAREQHDLFSERPVVETGSVDTEALVTSQHESGGDRFGPTRDDDQR